MDFFDIHCYDSSYIKFDCIVLHISLRLVCTVQRWRIFLLYITDTYFLIVDMAIIKMLLMLSSFESFWNWHCSLPIIRLHTSTLWMDTLCINERRRPPFCLLYRYQNHWITQTHSQLTNEQSICKSDCVSNSPNVVKPFVFAHEKLCNP